VEIYHVSDETLFTLVRVALVVAVVEVPVASTGFVKASAYADKLRRTVFAQVKEYVKRGVIGSRQVAYRVGRLNAALYKVLVEVLGVSKDDVVRIRVPYEVRDGDLHIDYSRVAIEVYRFDPGISERAVEELRRVVEGGLVDIDFDFRVEKREGPTVFYGVYMGGERVGRLAVVDVGGRHAVSGAVIVGGKGYRVGGIVEAGESLSVALRRLVNEAVVEGREVPVEEAEAIVGGG